MEPVSIAEQLLFTTIRVETKDKSDRNGVGTGFIFSYIHENKNYPFLVTNKHVALEADKITLTFTRSQNGKPLMGIGVQICCPDDLKIVWHGHPNKKIDVVAAPLAPVLAEIGRIGTNVFFRNIQSDLIPSKEALKELDAIEEVIFIGYPIGLWDEYNLLPIVRRGITATPINLNFKGEPQFLIDASVFPGSSGSPVFIYNPSSYRRKSGGIIIGSRLHFLGIVSAGFYQQDISEIKTIPKPTVDVPVAVSKQMVDLGVVFKSSTIVETIESLLKQVGEIKK